jgi:putative ABC transport system permease protein
MPKRSADPRQTPVPALAAWIAARVAPADDRADVLHDLEEGFRERNETGGAASARAWYWRQTIRSIGPLLGRRLTRPGASRGPARIGDLRADLRYAVRRAARTPVVSLAVILAMALGIGATTAIVSVMESVFLEALPFPQPERLVRLGTSMRGLGSAPEVNALDARDWAAQSRTLERLGQFDVEPVTVRLDGADGPVSSTVLFGDAGMTGVLGLEPMLGRGLVRSDFDKGAVPVVVIGQRFWRDTFGGDPRVVGRSLGFGAGRATIVGVWPEAGDRFPAGGVDLWSPLTYPEDSFLNQRGSIALGTIARLRAGASVDAAAAELATIAARLAAAYPETNTNRAALIDPLQASMVGPVRPMLIVIALSIAAVLIVACANVANLLLAQTCDRGREFALRTSLGATRGRLVRQLLAESLLLYVVAGAAGIALAPAIARALIARYPDALPLATDVGIDGRVLLIAMAVTLAAALIASVPRLRALGRPSLSADLAEGARGLVSRPQRRASAALVVAQVAVSIVVLLGAGALLRTFLRLSSVATGLDDTRVVTMRLTLPESALQTPERTLRFQDAARALAASLPGVERAAHAMFLPFAAGNWHDGYERVGAGDVRPNLPMADFYMVSPEFLSTLGIAIRQGRGLTASDDRGAPVLVVSETLAARAFPGQSAIGKQVRWENRTWEIVGIAADARHGSLWDPPDPDVYVPRAQVIRDNTWLVLRTTRPAAAIAGELRARLRTLDPGAALTDIRRLDARVAESLASERFRALLTGSLGSLALLLAAVGIYGVVSYTVSRSTREIGIRMALGQSRRDVVLRVLAGIWAMVAGGVVLGGAVTRLADGVIAAWLPGLPVWEAGTLLPVVAVFFTVATLAALGPARRASRVDLVDALRADA